MRIPLAILMLAVAALVPCVPLCAVPSSRPDIGATIAGGTGPDGTQIACDLPMSQQMHNTGGSDGAGLCVFTSIAHAARWQQVGQLEDFQQFMKSHPGGGYPDKVDKMIAAASKAHGMDKPDYLQSEGMDLELLKAACKSGRMPGVTYSFSPSGRYGGKKIAHMVSLIQATDQWFVILDNNYPCDAAHPDNYEWLTPQEFQRVYAPGWAVILLDPPPPPLPATSEVTAMRLLVLASLATLLCLVPFGPAAGGSCPSCSGGSCNVYRGVAVPSVVMSDPGTWLVDQLALPANATFHWEEFSTPDPRVIKLMLGDRQVGVWNRAMGHYTPLMGPGQWGPRCTPPIEPPAAAKAARILVPNIDPIPCKSDCGLDGTCRCKDGQPCDHPACPCANGQSPNFGVALDQIKPGRLTLNGKSVSRANAFEALEGKTVPDDINKQRVTVIGSAAVRQQVVKDLAATPEGKAVVIKDYDPTHWAVKDSGFVTSGNPTIYCQAPTGQVLHRQDDYKDGIAGVVKALRRADPNYDASKDPDLRRDPATPHAPTPAPSPGPAPVSPPAADPVADALASVPASTWAMAGAMGIGGLYLLRKKKS